MSEKRLQADTVIAMGVRELERISSSVKDNADRIVRETTKTLEALRAVASRDVFKGAHLLAIGEMDVRCVVEPAQRFHLHSSGNDIDMTVVTSKVDGEFVTGRPLDSNGYKRRLKAMLVVYDEEPDTAPRPPLER